MNGGRNARVAGVLLVLASACSDDGGTSSDPTDPNLPGGGDPTVAGDTISPSVVATDPGPEETHVSPLALLEITFSEPVLVGSMNSGFLELTSDGRVVSGLADQISSTTVVFSPAFPLDFGTSYRAIVRTGVVDTAGNSLQPSYQWDFSTDGRPMTHTPAEGYLRHIEVLAHDTMRGRFTGSAEELAAARYVREEFRAMGLEAGVPEYFQTFVIPPGYSGTGRTSQNVLGVLPGSGELASEWIVVGAHYDHIGTTLLGSGNEVAYNGADDNASGTAMMIEVARTVTERVDQGAFSDIPRRTVLFHAYGAEEVGLVGSYHFCENPTVPLARVSAMMNLDMVGRLRDGHLEVIGPQPAEPLARIVAYLSDDDLSPRFLPDLAGRSDQRCFREAGRPVIFLHTGTHLQYHSPFDDVELINGQGVARIGRMASEVLVKLMVRR